MIRRGDKRAKSRAPGEREFMKIYEDYSNLYLCIYISNDIALESTSAVVAFRQPRAENQEERDPPSK